METQTDLDRIEKKETEMLRTAGHLSDVGTVTSLASTGIYFAEQKIGKTVPKLVNNLTLGAVLVGIGAVASSFVVRYQAGKIALKNDEKMEKEQSAWDKARSVSTVQR